jgi:undecaprenyl-diphosphatase
LLSQGSPGELAASAGMVDRRGAGIRMSGTGIASGSRQVPNSELIVMFLEELVVLALIQGAAELLPVSSSAHVITAARFMHQDPGSAEFMFLLIMLHTGTMFAVIAYFWPRWRRLFATPEKTGGGSGRHFLLMVMVATVATLALGLGLKFGIEKVVFKVQHISRNLPLIAGSLFAVGLLIIAAGFRRQEQSPRALTPATAMWIGLIQGLCLPFRGFSRSGATISVGLFRGLSRELAEDFSFALAVAITPFAIAYGAYELWKEKGQQGISEALRDMGPGLLGMLCSFIAGLLALRFLSAVLERGRWRYFGYYCVVAAALVLLAAWHLGDLKIPAVRD